MGTKKVITGAICHACGRWYNIEECDKIDETQAVPCGHEWAGLFDTVAPELPPTYLYAYNGKRIQVSYLNHELRYNIPGYWRKEEKAAEAAWKHYRQNFCQHVLDEGDHGEILCNKPASNQCRDCKETYCDEHFNEFMNLCDVDSEVEAAKHI